MTDFFGLIGKESSEIGRDLINKLSNSCHIGSFRCYYEVGFDLSMYEDDYLFVELNLQLVKEHLPSKYCLNYNHDYQV